MLEKLPSFSKKTKKKYFCYYSYYIPYEQYILTNLTQHQLGSSRLHSLCIPLATLHSLFPSIPAPLMPHSKSKFFYLSFLASWSLSAFPHYSSFRSQIIFLLHRPLPVGSDSHHAENALPEFTTSHDFDTLLLLHQCQQPHEAQCTLYCHYPDKN